MSFDIRPLQKALRALRFTTPLEEGDTSYVERSDGLGQQILDRIMVPTMHRLLLAGPAGCGKSTELLQLHRLAHPNYSVFVCPCDRDLDLYHFDPVLLMRYLLWRILFVTTTELSDNVRLTSEIQRDVLHCLGIRTVLLDSPRLFFSRLGSGEVLAQESASDALWSSIKLSGEGSRIADEGKVYATFSRLVSEIDRAFLPVLLLIDGLEKMPPTLPADTLGKFIRSPLLDQCQSVLVVPSWTLYGWESMEQYPDTEVLRIPVLNNPAFVRTVVERRAGDVFERDALESVAESSGGVVRDGLQIASVACRTAMSERSSPRIAMSHVERGRDALRQSFQSMLSDEPVIAQQFLHHVDKTGQLPGEPELRNRLLGNGLVLPNPDGTFRLHPCARW